jgi:hypothetical protein
MAHRSLHLMLGLLITSLTCQFPAEGQWRYRLGPQMRPVDLSKDLFTIEGDALLNPIYVFQASSGYRLNNTPYPLTPAPKFYALQTGQNAFLGSTPFSIISDFNQIGDQANAGYASIRLWFVHDTTSFFYNMRFKAGITHDKMQTNAPNVTYGYDDGGTELTFLLEKQVFKKLSDFDLRVANLMMNLNVQAGIFFPLAAVKPVVVDPGSDTIIRPLSNDRWQSISFHNGWGWQTGLKVDIGGVLCHEFFICRGFTGNCPVGHALFWFFRRLAFTVGSRFMMEELYSKPQILYYGHSGYRLKTDNYSVFFSGPVISFRWLSIKK